MTILGIETSCDETSAAVLTDGVVRSNIVSSQVVHEHFGGVVPELASRIHQKIIIDVVEKAIDDARCTKEEISAIAVTHGPGLVGSLLVGLCFAKAAAMSMRLPFVGVNHMEGHLYSNFLGSPKPAYPFIGLIVSGGHTMLVRVDEPLRHSILGQTRDDAAGEAYDKVARMLGLGYPGGPIVDRMAMSGQAAGLSFPSSSLEDSLDFSFSGTKTAVLYYLRSKGYSTDVRSSGNRPEGHALASICAAFQESVVDVLVAKTVRAAKRTGIRTICLAGGVSANSLLRERMKEECSSRGWQLLFPALEYCIDNAAMIALVGDMKLSRGMPSDLTLQAVPYLSMDSAS